MVGALAPKKKKNQEAKTGQKVDKLGISYDVVSLAFSLDCGA